MKREILNLSDIRSTTVVNETGCWTWTKGKTGQGYPKIQLRRKQVLVHRLVLEIKLDRSLGVGGRSSR